VPDLWLTGDHFVGKLTKLSAIGQPTRPTPPSILPGSVSDYGGGGTLSGRLGLRAAAGQSPCVGLTC